MDNNRRVNSFAWMAIYAARSVLFCPGDILWRILKPECLNTYVDILKDLLVVVRLPMSIKIGEEKSAFVLANIQDASNNPKLLSKYVSMIDTTRGDDRQRFDFRVLLFTEIMRVSAMDNMMVGVLSTMINIEFVSKVFRKAPRRLLPIYISMYSLSNVGYLVWRML